MPGIGNGERDNALKDGRILVEDPRTGAQSLVDAKHLSVSFHEKRAGILGDRPVGGGTSLLRKVDVKSRPKEVTDGAPSFYFFETLLDEAHPLSKKFYDLILEAALLHARKQKDYGRDHDPFANVRASEEWGIDGWVGAMVRLSDKVRRLQALATKGELVNEAAIDSFMDIAVYALIACVLYEEQNGAGLPVPT